MASREINIRITATAGNTAATFQKISQGIQGTVTQAKTLGPAVQGGTQALGQLQGAAVSGNKAINQFGVGTEQASSKLGKFGKMFSDNRGIVFGVAGLTSALAEAVGMMGMYGDSQQRLKEAQAELNQLEEQGITSGKAHADAVAEVTKQQRFFNMVARNTVLSQMDMVFFTTMVISGLVKMNSEGGAAAGMLGKLKGMFSGLTGALSTTTNSFGSFMNNFSPLPTTLSKTQVAASGASAGINQVGVTSALSATRVLAFAGALAGIGLAVYGIYELISAAEKLKESLSKVFAESIMKINLFSGGVLQLKVMLNMATEEEKRAFAALNEATEIQTQAMQNLGFTGMKAFMLTDAELQLLNEEIARLSKEAGNAGTILTKEFQEPLTAVEALNQVIKDQQLNVGAVKDEYFDYINRIKEMGVSNEFAKQGIEAFVAKLNLVPEHAKTLTDALNKYFDDLIKKEKDTAKETEKMGKAFKAITDEVKMGQFFDLLSQGIAGTEQFFPRATKAVEDFKVKYGSLLDTMSDTQKIAQLKYELRDLDPVIRNLAIEEYTKDLADAKQGTKDLTEAEKESQEVFQHGEDIRQKVSQKYHEITVAASEYVDVTKVTVDEMIRATEAGDALFNGIEAQADAIRNNTILWANLKQEKINDIKEDLRLINSTARTNDMLAENEQWLLKLQLAYSAGLVEAKQWTEQTKLAGVQSQAFRDNLYQLNDVLLKEMDTFNMTTAEIQDYIQFAYGGRDATIELARASEEARDAMVESFSNLFDTEKFKDFKKEFKELDLRKVFGKDGAGDFKDMFADMRESAQDIEVLSTAMRALGVAVQDIDRMSGKDLAQNFDSFAEAYKKTIVEAGLGNPIVDQMIERWEKLSGTELRKELNQLPQTWTMINEAIKTNGISNTEANAIDIMRKKELGEINELTKEQIQVLNDAGFVYDETTGKITASKDAVVDFTAEMAKIEAASIVTETIQDMWTEMVTIMMEQNVLMAGHWTLQMLSVLIDAITTSEGIDSAWETLTSTLNSSFVDIANKWETAMKNVAHNSKAASSQSQSEFASLVKKLNSHFVKIANNFEKAMRNIAQNAKAAASQANSALASIKDRTVTITYKKVGEPKSQGDAFSFANGGLISASRGLMVSNGPTRAGPYLFGDNSGGREIMAFIPKDGHKAQKILDMINAQLGRKEGGSVIVAGGGGDRTITVPIVINIGGEQYSFVRKYRIKQGQEVASQVGG